MDTTPTEQDALFAGIAKDILGIATLETQISDRLEFHEIAVSLLRRALKAAYEAGVSSKANTFERTS